MLRIKHSTCCATAAWNLAHAAWQLPHALPLQLSQPSHALNVPHIAMAPVTYRINIVSLRTLPQMLHPSLDSWDTTHRSYLISACGTAQNMCRARVPEVPVLLHELEARKILPALFVRSLTCVIDSVALSLAITLMLYLRSLQTSYPKL